MASNIILFKKLRKKEGGDKEEGGEKKMYDKEIGNGNAGLRDG